MPYSKTHKENSRRRILDNAVKLFSAQGYDAVTLDQVMQDADLTRGAFYAHFKSKQILYKDAILHAASNGPVATLSDKIDQPALTELIRKYLDMSHVRQEGSPCPLAFLATDVAKQEGEIRETYTQVYKDIVDKVGALPTIKDTDSALAISALMIGGVAVARALNDDELSRDLLKSCRKFVEAFI